MVRFAFVTDELEPTAATSVREEHICRPRTLLYTVSREILNPEELADASELMYTQAIVDDGTLYMSGQIGWDDQFEVVSPDVESQARKAFENVEVVLSNVDKDLSDVAKVTSYVVDLDENGDGFRSVWSEVFDEPYPAHTLLGVDQLATEEVLVEIEVEVPIE